MISEGDSPHTPPESDAQATTPDAKDENGGGGGRFSFSDSVRIKRGGYRPLTPPPTPDDGDDGDRGKNNKLAKVQNNPPAKIATTQTTERKRKEKLDVESSAATAAADRRRHFIGIYPRHVVFLMVVCGIIGGMIGHLWNMSYGCSGGCDPVKHRELVAMYNSVLAEKWAMQERLMVNEAQAVDAAERRQRGQRQRGKSAPQWSGHEAHDASVKVEGEAKTASERAFIPSDQFESMIWEHLRETAEKRPVRESEKTQAEERSQKAKDDYFIHSHEGERELLEKTFFPNDNDDGGRAKQKRSVVDGSEEEEEEDGEKGNRRRVKEWKQQQQKQGSGSGERNRKYKSKESVRYQNQAKQDKYQRNGGGEGNGKRYRSGEDDDESREYGKRRERGGSDGKYQQQKQKYQENNNNGKKKGSGEWNDKRNRGRDELRRQGSGGSGERNWYLERGNEREINRVEMTAG